ncbi:unnamed protein product [Absidia cylindrospora]
MPNTTTRTKPLTISYRTLRVKRLPPMITLTLNWMISVNNLKQTQQAHSNDQTFDDLVSKISKSNTDSNTNETLDSLVNNLKQTETKHTNDQVLDGLVNDLKSAQPQHSNDKQVLDELVNDLKNSASQHTDDKVLDGLVNNLKSSESRHSNDDQELDDLISNLPSNAKDVDSLVDDIKSATATTKQQPGHQDASINSELDTLTKPTPHKNDNQAKTDDPDWDSMINDLKSLPSHGNQDTPKESTQTQGLDQVIDDLAKSLKNNKNDKSHSDAAAAPGPTDAKSFKSYIDGMDQDYTKYIDNNKASETKQVSHKNDAKVEESTASHANEWFTNSDLRSKIKNGKRAFKRSLLKRAESNYFTNDDQRSSTHANDAASEEKLASHPVWATNGGFFTNDDQRTNVNSGSVHNDAEWASDDAPSSRPVWATNGGFFTNDDQRTNINSGFVHNDAEWASDDADASRPMWATNGGFFTNDDQRASVNSGAHNDAEWAEDAAAVSEENQDGVWHMDEMADIPEWNVDDDAPAFAGHEDNAIWESEEQTDEPVSVEAPTHHPNDIEWNVPNQQQEAPNHHVNDIEWNADDDTSAFDHTNLVHWDSEADDIEDEKNDDAGHVNADVEGEWVDNDATSGHINDATNDLKWAQDSVEDDLEDEDDTVAAGHGNGEWQTDEHVNDDDALDDNSNRWSLNEDTTEWSTNAFDENDTDLPSSIPGHANDNAAATTTTPEWASSEHANDDHEDDAMSWNVNDGPSEWSVDGDDDASSHGNDGAVPSDQAHDNDATLTSKWSTDEHVNDDEEHVNSEWTVNEASTGWSVNEAASGWSVDEEPSAWTTNEQHVDADEWNVNEAVGDWNVAPPAAGQSSHPNASPQWLTSESDHPNVSPQWLTSESEHPNASPQWLTSESEHPNASPQWLTSESDHPNASPQWLTSESEHPNASPQWLTSESDHPNASPQWLTSENTHSNDVNW